MVVSVAMLKHSRKAFQDITAFSHSMFFPSQLYFVPANAVP